MFSARVACNISSSVGIFTCDVALITAQETRLLLTFAPVIYLEAIARIMADFVTGEASYPYVWRESIKPSLVSNLPRVLLLSFTPKS